MKTHFNLKQSSKWFISAVIMIVLQLLLSSDAHAFEPVKETRFVITIIDTGIDLKNAILKPHLCRNNGESGLDNQGRARETNGIDDDGNGFTDDLHGWSFFDNSKDVQDNHGHGTHIASILYQELKNLKLESKFCFQVLKYFDSDVFSPHLLQASNNSFKYAYVNGSRLINYSGGGYTASKEEEYWLKKIAQKNIPVMAAMGNQTLNTDQFPFYPAGYNLENIFAIGAAESNETRARFSNYGKKHFDFLAPGVSIKGFGLNNTNSYLSGTSQATAKASVLVAYLMYQQKEELNWSELKLNLKNLRQVYVTKNPKGNLNFIDTKFIKKYKTSRVDAFGDPESPDAISGRHY